ncbi:MAG: MCE family protein [Saprospirales bacterium]|nr:MCE family protein [Saprospirales bacterium]
MALQDLTPQLRTRLSRMERAVGWFVALAGVLLVIGFAYYIQNTAKRRGWFLEKISYRTCVSNGAGLKVGDPVKLMGFDVGEITAVIPNAPDQYFNITIEFRVMLDHYNYPGYIWSDSKVKVSSGDTWQPLSGNHQGRRWCADSAGNKRRQALQITDSGQGYGTRKIRGEKNTRGQGFVRRSHGPA